MREISIYVSYLLENNVTGTTLVLFGNTESVHFQGDCYPGYCYHGFWLLLILLSNRGKCQCEIVLCRFFASLISWLCLFLFIFLFLFGFPVLVYNFVHHIQDYIEA